VPLDNVEFTAFQDRANDWLDKAWVDIAAAGDATLKKTTETWQVMTDFADAEAEFTAHHAANAIDAGVELAGKARTSVEALFHREDGEPGATAAPGDTEAPEGSEAPATGAPSAAPATDAPLTPATDAPEDGGKPDESPAIRLPDTEPDAGSALPLGEGTLHENGEFEPGEVQGPTDAPTKAPTEAPTELPTKIPEESSESAAAAEPAEAPDDAVETPDDTADAPDDAARAADDAAEAADEDEADGEIPGTPLATLVDDPEATDAPTAEPTAEPTEEPTAEPTPEPTPEPPYIVKPAGEATVYFYPGAGSKGFHRFSTAHGMDGAPAHTLAEALASGKNPCKSCEMPTEEILDVAHIAWVDEENRIHTTDECASFAGQWKLVSLEDAVAAGDSVCTDCGADLYVEEIVPAPTPTPMPIVVSPSTALKPASEATVYFFDNGRGYHMASSCVGMHDAPAHTLAEAQAAGKHPCGNCTPPALELADQPALWVDEDGLCHTSDACDAFKGAYKLVPRDEALEREMSGCPDCGADEYLVPGTVLAE